MAAQKTEITHVCLSDLHLGEEDSLLTDIHAVDGKVNPAKPSPPLTALAECLRALLSNQKTNTGKPVLILNGDLLELALARTDQAIMVFERFVELVLPKGGELFSRIIYLPGNHDHHMWEMGRETQYVEFVRETDAGDEIEPPYHTTGMFLDHNSMPYPTCTLLTALIERHAHLKDAGVRVELAYPNYATPFGDKGRYVVFHHGHFVESIYQLMSRLRGLVFPGRPDPVDIYQLECENFAWIDFFWSALGRSCGVGADVEKFYEKIADEDARKRLIDSLAHELAKRYDLPYILGNWAEEKVIKLLVNKLLEGSAGLERHRRGNGLDPGISLSRDSYMGLVEYLDNWLRKQITTERKDNEPVNISFVFGHTHKPFTRPLRMGPGYADRVGFYNTGGWVIGGVDPDRVHGAAIAVVDKCADVVNIRMYDEGSDDGIYLEEAMPPTDPECDLRQQIRSIIEKDTTPWVNFTQAARRAVFVRAENLRKRLASA